MVPDAAAAFPDDLGSLPSPVPDPVAYQVRRHVGPHTDARQAGIVRHEVAAGDVVDEGDLVARIVPPNGDPAATEAVESDGPGWVIQRGDGLARYERDAVAMMAIEDDGDLIWSPAEAE